MTALVQREQNTVADRDSWKHRWWRWRARNPESAVAALAASAWIGMAVVHWGDHDTTPIAAARSRDYGPELALWALMTIAMMVPGTIGMVRRLALDSLFSRRQRHIGLFTGIYVAAWTGVAALLLVVERVLAFFVPSADLRGTPLLVATLVAAGAWQLSGHKARFLNSCHLRSRLSPRGRAADASVVRYAVNHARACIGSCWLVMFAMFVAGHDFHLMVPLVVITTYERFVKRPNQRAAAAGLFVLAALTAFGLN